MQWLSVTSRTNKSYVRRQGNERNARTAEILQSSYTVSIVSAIGIVKNRCGVIDAHRGLISIDRSLPTRLCKWSRSVGLMSHSGPRNFAGAFKFPYIVIDVMRSAIAAICRGQSLAIRTGGKIQVARASLARFRIVQHCHRATVYRDTACICLRSYRNFLSTRLAHAPCPGYRRV